MNPIVFHSIVYKLSIIEICVGNTFYKLYSFFVFVVFGKGIAVISSCVVLGNGPAIIDLECPC